MRSYLMKEYSNILKPNGIDISKAQGTQYYQNHLRAIELQKQEEQDDREAGKATILHAAQLMEYNDDFDEEDIYKRGPLN